MLLTHNRTTIDIHIYIYIYVILSYTSNIVNKTIYVYHTTVVSYMYYIYNIYKIYRLSRGYRTIPIAVYGTQTGGRVNNPRFS